MSLVYLLFFILLLMFSIGSFSNRVFGARFMSGSGISKVFSGYLIILLVAGLLSTMVPVEGTLEAEYLTDKELAENDRLNSDIYSIVESGRIEEAEGLTKKENWDFPIKGKLLDIEFMGENVMIFIEKVDSLEGKVEVTYYSTYSYVHNIDITDRFKSPDIELTESTLKVFPAEHVNIKLVKFTNAFPFNQFTEDGEQYNGGYGMMQGLNFLYVTVPADTEVTGDGYVIN
ncbi:hypothetical protein LC048_18460 [Mesobacillus subterraneus]|uniref:hypothetical protein n=1 Tax=Mesobacillus subterraneus TaxID=285983 RepID=UPI001CFCCE15|nr:hypothetical protein [Mesobacillus subterraneus]WLR54401.1 hypothetical protein LC048_18460 [Mesobacillus subterraneus]